MRRVGIDIGGTFTDLVYWNDDTGHRVIHKRPSTPDDPARAGLLGMAELCEKADINFTDIDLVLHGTTVATNLLLERKGACTGLITNTGFRDILHIGRKNRPLNFAHNQQLTRQNKPLIPRRYRLGVSGRISAPDGAVVEALDEQAVREKVLELKVTGAVEAVVICGLHAYLNSEHERRIKEITQSLWPEIFISASHEVVPLHREYERMSTAALNAYVGPGTGHYLERFRQGLRDAGCRADVYLMTSAGGVIAASEAAERPVSLLLSGPVGALMGGLQVGREVSVHNVITLDVGGTSADIGVAPNGQVRMKQLLDTQIAGYDAMVPMCDIDTIGAGGGSIAWVDEGGMIRVGPASAGAVPGPACYGLGGDKPTVTDAMVTLGWYRPEAFRDAGLSIEPGLAHKAITQHIAEPMAMTVEEAAAGIFRLAVHSMVEAVRINSVSRGMDPREFALVSFGGAGAAFAAAVAAELSMPTAIVPPAAGVGAAGGLLATDMKYTRQATCWQALSNIDTDQLAALFDRLRTDVMGQLVREGFSEQGIELRYSADCRYVGQGYELAVDVPQNPNDPAWCEQVLCAFHQVHQSAHHRHFPDKDVLIVSVSISAVGQLAHLESMPLQGTQRQLEKRVRPVLFPVMTGVETFPTQFVSRHELAPLDKLVGPLVIEQVDTTTVVPPGFSIEVHPLGHLLLYPNSEGGGDLAA